MTKYICEISASSWFYYKKTYYGVLLNVNVTVFWNTQNSLRRYRIPYDNVAVVWVIILLRNDKKKFKVTLSGLRLKKHFLVSTGV